MVVGHDDKVAGLGGGVVDHCGRATCVLHTYLSHLSEGVFIMIPRYVGG